MTSPHPRSLALLGSFIGLLAGCLIPATRMSASSGASGDAGSSHNLLASSTFDDGVSLPWSTSFTAPANGEAAVVDGALCVTLSDVGKQRWDAQLRHREMVVQRGHSYRVSFRAWASKPTRARPKVGMAGPPYAEYWADTIDLQTKPQRFAAEFLMSQPDDPTAELAFHLGAELAAAAPLTICIDDIALDDPQFTRRRAVATKALPGILVNQLGYLPGLSKRATLRSTSEQPQAFRVLDGAGAVVSEGQTEVIGADAASGDRVHRIDFSSVTQEGRGYRLQVGDQTSHPFDIRADLYAQLRTDALAFFYHQRSGIALELPYAREARWVRPAGHVADRSVRCAPSAGCSYALDVSGGWYDAGDHGKYVVNGGISVWTLLDQYERSAQAATLDRVADGRLQIPEAGNGVSDLLDEARWELEFLLKMQVPAGKPLAGMAHHKIHDAAWTELGVAPHEDEQPRVLMAPSTAATLNLAAVAAQAARIYRAFDPAFAERCLVAARRAYDAALAHPKLLAPESNKQGGGPYDDSDLRDELYWAAAELLVTTAEARYRDALASSPFAAAVAITLPGSGPDSGHHTALTWQNVATAGTISLALAPASLPERSRARAALITAADGLLALSAREGYALPFAPNEAGTYPWGSNSFVLNNALVLALAYDFSRDAKYLSAVVSALDYLLGHNPLDQSYVTGYGARPLVNPHHRFFAHQVRSDRPAPPPGIVSGGPNSALQDPIARAAGLAGKPPQKCFLDHIESWSTNEVTINWNAPLAWVVAFVDDAARAP